MKNIYTIGFSLLFALVVSCGKTEISKESSYVFLKRYCATVTVGGVVGIAERCFEIGDVVDGKGKTGGIITIRIAAYSYLNDGPPSSASYQEFLDVPSNYVEIVK